MKLTQEEFAAVAVYEQQIQTAVRSNYLRNVGRSGLAVLVPIYERATASKLSVNGNCAACILDLLKRIGAIYFADKAEQEQQAAAATASTSEVKTRGRGRRTRIAE